MTDVCKNCGHPDIMHPHGFMCAFGSMADMEDCRCPGWVKKVEGVNYGK